MKVLLLSDIHSNLEALEAVLSAFPPSSITATWSAGDITGYGPDPSACIHRIQALRGLRGVLGNHDRVVAGLSAPIGFNPLAIQAAYRNIQLLQTGDADWLRSLPGSELLTPEIGLYHGSPCDPDEYLLTAESAESSFILMEKNAVKLGIFGHTHVPALYMFDSVTRKISDLDPQPDSSFSLDLRGEKRYLLNPGSVGQPRDGNPNAGFALLTFSEEGTIEVKFKRIVYPVADCQEKMVRAGFPERLHKRLSIGF
ncbi:MAG: metallophosphoesterase family protein [Candidatus Ozemobacteraceae bacterium]